MSNFGLSALGVCLAAGLAAAGYFGSQTIVNGHKAVNLATVKGLAERVAPADAANWSIGYVAAVRSDTAPPTEDLFRDAEAQRNAVLKVLRDAGFAEAEITATPLRYRVSENRDYEGVYQDTSYTVSGAVRLRTQQLDKAEAAYFAMSDLPRQGYPIELTPPEYLFTSLNDIKPDLLREATENARIAAEEFAKNAGVAVGGIQRAAQGGFSVRDRGSEHSETESREKLVRVVTTITFYLEN
jgi:hypothetical protein